MKKKTHSRPSTSQAIERIKDCMRTGLQNPSMVDIWTLIDAYAKLEVKHKELLYRMKSLEH